MTALDFANELARALDAKVVELPWGDRLGQWAVVRDTAHLAIVRQHPHTIGVNLPDGSPLEHDVAKAAKAAQAATNDAVSPFELALAIHDAVREKLSHATTIGLPAQGNRIPEVNVRSDACYVNLGLRFIERSELAHAIRVALDEIAIQVDEYERALASIPKMESFAKELLAKLADVPTPNRTPWKLFASCVPKVRNIVLHYGASHLDAVTELFIAGGEPFVRVRKWRSPLEATSVEEVALHVVNRLAVLTKDRLKKKKRYRVLQQFEGCDRGDELTFLGTEWEHDRFEVFHFARANGDTLVLRDSAIVNELEHYLEAV